MSLNLYTTNACSLACAVTAFVFALFCALLGVRLLRLQGERREERSRLLQTEKGALLSRMVAGVAHDLNSHTGVVLSAVSFLHERWREVQLALEENRLTRSAIEGHFQDERETLQIVELNLDKIAGLVKSFKRLSVDQANEGIETFNVKEYVDQILLSLHPRIRKTRVRVKLACDSSLTLDMWPGAFSQILTNLIDNALTHAFIPDAEGTISIEIHTEGGDVILVVADSGKGMTDDIAARIFDPFFTTRAASGGTGLGLYVVSVLVREDLKGSIACESSPGEGTRFTIRFPQHGTSSEARHE